MPVLSYIREQVYFRCILLLQPVTESSLGLASTVISYKAEITTNIRIYTVPLSLACFCFYLNCLYSQLQHTFFFQTLQHFFFPRSIDSLNASVILPCTKHLRLTWCLWGLKEKRKWEKAYWFSHLDQWEILQMQPEEMISEKKKGEKRQTWVTLLTEELWFFLKSRPLLDGCFI